MAHAHSNKSRSWVLTLLGVSLVVAILHFTKEVLLPLALAALLSFLLTPLVIRLERARLGRIPAVLIAVTLGLAIVAGIGWIVTKQLVQLAGDVPKYEATLRTRVRWVRDLAGGEQTDRLLQTFDELQNELNRNNKEQPLTPTVERKKPLDVRVVQVQTEPWPLRLARDWLAPLLGPLGMAVIVVIFVIFMLIQREDLRDRLIRLAGTGRVYVTTQAMDEAASKVSRYLVMQLLVNTCYGLVIAVGLFLVGLPNALLWGLLATIFRFIPYVGPWIAAVFPLALSLAVFDTWTQPLLILALFVVDEVLCANAVEPWLYGASTGISSVGIIAAATFWTWLWGPVGLVLSMPLTACIVVLGRHVPQMNFVNVLLSDEPALELSVRFYQRLLTFDAHEASELVNTFLQSGTLDDLYEQMFLPALSLSELDRNEGRLSDSQQRFIHRVIRDLAAETQKQFDVSAATQSVPPGAAQAAASETPNAPQGRSLHVACLPAEDKADRIAGQLIQQLLQARGHQVETVPHRVTSPHTLTILEGKHVDLVVISGLAPGGAMAAREGCQRLRSRLANLKIVVGLWNAAGPLTRTKERLTSAGADFVTTSLREAADRIQDLATQPPPARTQ